MYSEISKSYRRIIHLIRIKCRKKNAFIVTAAITFSIIFASPFEVSGQQNREQISNLIVAIKTKNIVAVRNISKNEQYVNMIGSEGWTPVMYASYRGYNEILVFLLNHHAKVNFISHSDEFTPLYLATMWEREKSVQILLSHGAKPNLRSTNGWTAVMHASVNCNSAIMRLLLSKGASPNFRLRDDGKTALMLASGNRSSTKSRDVVKLLLDYGASVNAESKGGNTALMIASARGNLGTVKLLLKAGSNVGLRNSAGKSALDFATKFKQDSIVQLLKAHNKRLDNSH